MERLTEDWLTEGLIDFEYKKYVLMAYLKTVKESFGKVELYPFLADLVFHYRQLKSLRDSKQTLADSFPRSLSAEKLKHLEIGYRRLIEDDALMQEIESIIEFAVPRLKESLDEGAFIYDYVESQCTIAPVGLAALYTNEGYLFVTQPPENETNIYRYQMTVFEDSAGASRGLNMTFVETRPRTLSSTYENMKIALAKQFTQLPNPAAYLVISRLKFPFTQTLMPVAKRLLVKEIAKNG